MLFSEHVVPHEVEYNLNTNEDESDAVTEQHAHPAAHEQLVLPASYFGVRSEDVVGLN